MVSTWEVSSWPVDIYVFQKRAHALYRLDVLAQLPLELSDCQSVLLQLSVKQEEVADEFGHILVPLFHLVIEGLLVMLVQLKRANNDLLAHIHQWNDQCTLASSDGAIARTQVLILVLTLLVQEHVLQRLLDILEVKGDPIRFGQHGMDQVLL